MKRTNLLLLFTLLGSSLSIGQTKEDLVEINQTWEKFCDAFKSLDASLVRQIHTNDLIRISDGRRIVSYENYMSNYELQFENLKQSNQTNHIELRFFERITNGEIASDRGIYQLTRNKGTDREKNYYGQFHVILKKINGEWQISMDYDSSKSNTIDKEDFDEAYAMKDIDRFLN